MIAPNLTVFERLKEDFKPEGGGSDIFDNDPLITVEWRGDWNLTTVLQDEAGGAHTGGVLYLTNSHRLFDNPTRRSAKGEALDWRGPAEAKATALDTGAFLRDRITSHERVMVLNDEAPAVQSVVPESLLAGLPDRLKRAADEAISLYRFFEKKPGVNFAPVFTALLGAVDECAKGLVIQKLSPSMPANQVDQQDWFSPYLGKVDQRMRRHYEKLGRNLRKTLVYRSGISPLGMLRSCLDYALNDSTKIGGVFDTMTTGLRFTGARDLLDRVRRLNDFRNSHVAHQENPLTDPHATKRALSEWIEAMDQLWKAGNLQTHF